MKELYSRKSQNGQRGLAIVGPEGTELPAEGSLRNLGNVAGVTTFLFTSGKTGNWIMVSDDVTVHGGATVVEMVDLCGGSVASLLLLGEMAVVEHHGYKRRTSRLAAYVKGVEADVPASVLVAMGLVKAKGGDSEDVPPPPPMAGPMADAMKAAFG